MDWQKYASTCNTIVVTIAVVASGLWAVEKYRDEAAKQLEARRFEAARPFLQRQLDLCVEASDAAAALASARRPEGIVVARDRFWQLYIGSLHIVEDFGEESVAVNMAAFGDALKKAPAAPGEMAALDIDQRGLEALALNIGRSCRALIVAGWRGVVPHLE